MKKNARLLIEKLVKTGSLSLEEYQTLIESYSPQLAEYAAAHAVKVRKKIYGNKVYVRGLIEISNICKNDCYYCGIRRSNSLFFQYD